MADISIFQDKSTRPRIRPRRSPMDWAIDVLTIDLLIAVNVYAFLQFGSLPPTITTKVDSAGQVTDTGPAWTVLMMPGLAVGICLILWIVQLFPWAANTLVTITQENALRQYRLLNRLLSLLGLMIALTFCLISYDIIRLAQGSAPISSDFILVALPVTCSIILPGWYITRSVQLA